MGFKNKNKKNLLLASVLITITILNMTLLHNNYNKINGPNYKEKSIESQGEYYYTKEMLNNPTFEEPIAPWYNTSDGDTSDVNASTGDGEAKFEVLGENGVFELIADPPNAIDWENFTNRAIPSLPDVYEIDDYGIHVEDEWEQVQEQLRYDTSVHYKHNVTMGVNMSDFIITSASIQAEINATVVVSPITSGIEAGNDVDDVTQWITGDYIRFYVSISDLNNMESYDIAEFKTNDLGQDDPEISMLNDTYMISVPEEVLIFYLTSILEYDNNNFTIILGMDIHNEDNSAGSDTDTWSGIYIKSVNLTFTYEKKIDQSSFISWNQIGNKISGSNVQITEAKLNFLYKIDQNWTELSQNSEIRVWINNYPHTETIKLSNANTTFQEAKEGGFDVTPLIIKDVNISFSIQVFLADEFPLDRKITISIDNASLEVNYSETLSDIETKLDLKLNGANKTLEKSIEIIYGETLNITAIYANNSGDFIPNATVGLTGGGLGDISLIENQSLEIYYTIIDTKDLGVGNSYFTLSANKTYYETQIMVITVTVLDKHTELQLFIDGFNETLDRSSEIVYGNNASITITYKDTEQEPYLHISNATVELTGVNEVKNLTENIVLEEYNIEIDSKILGLGNTYITIVAQNQNYTSQTIIFKIEVLERGAYIDDIFLNDYNKTLEKSLDLTFGEMLNITLKYKDETNSFISNATVLARKGQVILGTLNESVLYDHYNISLNTSILGTGVHFLTLTAEKGNYTHASEVLTIFVNEKGTYHDLFLDGFNRTLEKSINKYANETLNITITFKELLSKKPIANASILITGGGISDYLTEYSSLEQYSISINTTDLGQGTNFFTIYAQKEGFQPQSTLFSVVIEETATSLKLFLDGIEKTSQPSIKMIIGYQVNFTIDYNVNQTGEYIENASANLLGEGLDETLEEYGIPGQFSIIINSLDLNWGVNFLTIYAFKINYKPQTILITIEIIDRETNMEIYLNNMNATLEKSIDLPIGADLNISIKYSDYLTGTHIQNSTVQLVGEGLSEVLTENYSFKQYSILINTVELDIGVSYLTIYAQRPNYQSYSVLLRVNVKRIETEILTESGNFIINTETGENIILSIVLNDLNFNHTIKNASVTYSWAFGQGELFDLDGNGIYEVTLENVREGTHTIVISVYEESDNYEFNRVEITIVAIATQKEPNLLFQILGITGVIVAVSVGGYFIAYQRVLKYPKTVRKIHKFEKSLKKKHDPDVEIKSRKEILKTAYEEELSPMSKFIKIEFKEKIPEHKSSEDNLFKTGSDSLSNDESDDSIKKE